jgi:lysine N6-hydroxylase
MGGRSGTDVGRVEEVEKVEEHDVVGVGLGPFNLGLAALLAHVDDVDAVFLEARAGWAWHPGLLLDGTTLQVPFLADLVTLADPTSPYSFLNYLHRRGRLYRFYFYERFHVPRQEYDDYCRWVAGELPSCRFGQRVVEIRPRVDGRWSVLTQPTAGAGPNGNGPNGSGAVAASGGALTEHRAGAVVLGVGSRPALPAWAHELVGETVLHSGDYLGHRERVSGASSVTVIGSGQSAAEVFADLLAHGPGRMGSAGRLDWFTRSRGFLPMEYSKLGLEHFTPEYTAYFHGLAEDRRDTLRAGQDLLYKGISSETSEQIYDTLYEASIGGREPNVGYRSACELRAVDPVPAPDPGRRWRLTLHHLDEDVTFHHDTDVVVLATGYEPAPLPLSPGLADLVERDGNGRPVVDLDYRLGLRGGATSTLFVQNAELHTHGVGAPDLGLGAHRNAVIINALAGREVYPVRPRNVFQSFGTPPTGRPAAGARAEADDHAGSPDGHQEQRV